MKELTAIMLGMIFILLFVYLICDFFKILKNKELPQKIAIIISLTITFIIVLCIPPISFYIQDIGEIIFYLIVILLIIKYLINPLMNRKVRK